MDYRTPFGELGVIKALLSVVPKPLTAEAAPTSPKDVKEAISPIVNLGTVSEPLAYGNYKIELAENTVDRVRVSFGKKLNAYATFANYSRSRFGVSAALSASWPARQRARLQEFRLAPYGLFHFYFQRPEHPPLGVGDHPGSFGPFIGLRLSDDAFHDLLGGISFGHLAWNAGTFVGVNVRREGSDDWLTRIAIGLQYTL